RWGARHAFLLASLGAAIGLGFLSQYEGVFIHYVFIHYLLPLFAGLTLLANVIGGLRHRQWLRMALDVIGPVLVLTAALFMAAWLLYPVVLMVAVSIWDLWFSAGKGSPRSEPRHRLLLSGRHDLPLAGFLDQAHE
ncbi:MerC mercury resistance protein, partial [mine drainage metagenome]